MSRRQASAAASSAGLALALTAALAVVGCGAGSSTPERRVFADADAPLWHAGRLESEREIATWDTAAPWRVSGASVRRTELGLVLGVEGPADGEGQGPAPGPAILALDVVLAAASVEDLELRVEAAPPLGRVELRWIFEQGSRRGEGRLDLDLNLLAGDRLRAPVASHGDWRGRIRRLEWRFSRIPDGQRLLVRGLRAVVTDDDSQALARALSTAWRVDLGRDVRPALLSLPGLERDLELRVPEGGLFRVALGATAPRGETTFLLRVRTRDEVSELWRVAPTPDQLASWRPVAADLSPWAGQDVTLELIVEGPHWTPGEGLPAWGGPELVTAAPADRPDARPDIVLISADTLRADHLSLYGYPRPTSPVIDAWASARAVVFEQAVAASPWTLPSHVSMLSGFDVLSHGVHIGLPTPRRLDLLAERLRAHGYATFAETGGGYLHPSYGLGQGFDVFRYPRSQMPEAGDLEAAVRRAIAFAERQPGPVFLFLHSYETHEPYSARPELGRLRAEPGGPAARTWVTEWVPPRPEEGYVHRRRFVDAASGVPPADHGAIVDLYDSRVAHLDGQLAPLFAWLEGRRPTAVLLTSDHGESLGEDGRGGHASLERQLLHIPLVLALPDGAGAGRSIDARVRLYDVMPTLLDIAGVEPSETLDGESLLPLLERPEPREAWAASPSTNAGVTYDRGDDWRFRWQPAAWAEGGLGRYEALARDAEGADGDAPPVEEGERRVLRRLEQTARGLELLVTHDGPGDLVLELAGSAVQNHRLKSLDDGVGAPEWRGQVDGARLRLAPGNQRRLLIDTPLRGDLELRVGEHAVHLDLDAERLPSAFERTDDGWRRARGTSSPRSGVRLRWLGTPPEADGEAAVDGELQKQLRALGYTG